MIVYLYSSIRLINTRYYSLLGLRAYRNVFLKFTYLIKKLKRTDSYT